MKMFNILKLLLILSFFKVSYCCSHVVFEKKISQDITDNERKFSPWLVEIRELTDKYCGISYGSLIHPAAVIADAMDMVGHDLQYLIVRTNCAVNASSKFLVNCTIRNVKDIIYPDDYDGHNMSENFYALLILQTPFDITPTIMPIKLINDMELIDKNHCLISHWLRTYHIQKHIFDLVPEFFELPYIDGEFRIDSMDKYQLNKSRDFIIKQEFYISLITTSHQGLPFWGSAIVCQCNRNRKTLYQIGIAAFGVEMTYKDLKKPLTHKGSFFFIVDYYDEIMRKLEENVT